METKRRLKLIFTGYKGNLRYHYDAAQEKYIFEVNPVSGKLLCDWEDNTTQFTMTFDENVIKDIFVPNADGKISAVAYDKLYGAANGIIGNNIAEMNGIIPCYRDSDFTSYFALFVEGGNTHLTTVEAVWEVVNVQPIESL